MRRRFWRWIWALAWRLAVGLGLLAALALAVLERFWAKQGLRPTRSASAP